MSEEIEIEYDDISVDLGITREAFDLIGAESEEYLQKLLETIPADPSAVGLIDPSSYETAPGWAYDAYGAMWAAAYQGRKAYAERIYTGCHLNGAHWSFSDIQADCPHPCPVCFEMSMIHWNARCGHHTYEATNDASDELPFTSILQRLDDVSEDLENEDLQKIIKIPEVDVILKNLAIHKPWFLGFDFAKDLRTFTVQIDNDRFGGIEYFGFHTDPKKFLADLEALEQSIIEKISACGIDLDDV
jgi:hypothetical protein